MEEPLEPFCLHSPSYKAVQIVIKKIERVERLYELIFQLSEEVLGLLRAIVDDEDVSNY